MGVVSGGESDGEAMMVVVLKARTLLMILLCPLESGVIGGELVLILVLARLVLLVPLLLGAMGPSMFQTILDDLD